MESNLFSFSLTSKICKTSQHEYLDPHLLEIPLYLSSRQSSECKPDFHRIEKKSIASVQRWNKLGSVISAISKFQTTKVTTIQDQVESTVLDQFSKMLRLLVLFTWKFKRYRLQQQDFNQREKWKSRPSRWQPCNSLKIRSTHRFSGFSYEKRNHRFSRNRKIFQVNHEIESSRSCCNSAENHRWSQEVWQPFRFRINLDFKRFLHDIKSPERLINAKFFGQTPCYAACKDGHLNVIKKLHCFVILMAIGKLNRH